MTLFVAKLIWGLGCVTYFIIRYPHQRRARKTSVTDRRDLIRERTLMLISYSGLFIIPLIYVLTDQPKFAGYTFSAIQTSVGVLVLIAAMALLYRTHRDLGRAWSITLEIRDKHTLITRGICAIRCTLRSGCGLFHKHFCCRTGSRVCRVSLALVRYSLRVLATRSG